MSEKFTVYCSCRPFSDIAKGALSKEKDEFARFRGQSQIKGSLAKN